MPLKFVSDSVAAALPWPYVRRESWGYRLAKRGSTFALLGPGGERLFELQVSVYDNAFRLTLTNASALSLRVRAEVTCLAAEAPEAARWLCAWLAAFAQGAQVQPSPEFAVSSEPLLEVGWPPARAYLWSTRAAACRPAAQTKGAPR